MHSILHNFFFYDEGPPKYLQTDNGTEFINEVAKKLCKSLGIRILHGRPYHPQSQGQVENLNKRVQKKLAKLLCQRPIEERAKLWPYLLPLVAKEIINTWHHTIQDVPFRVLKGRHTAEFRYPDDEDFFDEVPFVDDGEFGEDDAFSFSEACPLQYSNEENDDDEPVFSFAERLEIGCSLARTREETRLQALEALKKIYIYIFFGLFFFFAGSYKFVKILSFKSLN